ncbi:PREDICTED: odorant receptor 4-like [Nicrophorus vespilloides]|uniref:Odorant receptor n=1 Tax=Nicrophorus vespilloides TaxID=110193 RepID=A0ABM1MTQ8_NICVS|nr:PREDICTED: odorant receptor 4-like [Nicrophorus vespilloides]
MSFFELNVKILKISGLWVPLDARNYRRTMCLNLSNVFYSMVFFTIAEFAAVPASAADLTDLVKNLNMSVSFLLTFFKVAVWFVRRKEILNIMTILQSTSNSFENAPEFDPKRIVDKEQKIKDALTKTFFVLAFTVPTSACLLTLGTVIVSDDFSFKLPYRSYVPFNYRSSKFAYSVALVYQCFALLSCGTITVGFDMLFTSLVSFTSAHLQILQGAFRTIKIRCVNHRTKNVRKDMEREMIKCVKHLQLIVGICDALENIFTYLILLQMVVSLVVFCTCLYLISTMPITSLGNEIAYMLAIENQLAVYCYAGNKLTSRGEEIPFAIYESDWFGATKRYKNDMIMTMIRMGKPIYLTAGKFTVLTLSTFVTIGRGSYSLLAMLKNS